MGEKCSLCNMEVSSLAIHKKLNHKNMKTSSLNKKSFGFKRKRHRAEDDQSPAAEDSMKTCPICGMDNIVNLEQHTLIKHAIKNPISKRDRNRKSMYKKNNNTISEEANEEELGERVKKKLKRFKLQRKFIVLKADFDIMRSSTHEELSANSEILEKYDRSIGNLDVDKTTPQCCKCPFCDKTLFYGMVKYLNNLNELKRATTLHAINCNPKLKLLLTLPPSVQEKSKTLEQEVRIKQEDFNSQDDNVLFKVVHGLQGDMIKKTCYLVIDGLIIPWQGKFSSDALDSRLKNGPLDEFSSMAPTNTDLEGYIQVSETVLREREELRCMQGVLDCIENSLIKQEAATAALAHLEQAAQTDNKPINGLQCNYDNNDNVKASSSHQERVVIESIEDALKIEENCDDKEIKVEDDLIVNEKQVRIEKSIENKLQIDEKIVDEEITPHKEKDLDGDNINKDTSEEVEETEIMKQELNPDDILFPELIKDESNSSEEFNDPQESDKTTFKTTLADLDRVKDYSDLVASATKRHVIKEAITSPSVVTVSLLNNGLNKKQEKEPLFHLIIDPNQSKASQPVVNLLKDNNKRPPIVHLDNAPIKKKVQPVIDIIDDNDEDCIEILPSSNINTRAPPIVDLAEGDEGDTIDLSDTEGSLDDSIEIVDSNIT